MIYFGFDEVLYGWSRYFDLCNAFELRESDPSAAPSTKTLNKWRVDSPKGFAWILHAQPAFVESLVRAYEVGRADIDDEGRNGWAVTQERAHAVAAKALFLETPPELPPSDVSRTIMREVGGRLTSESKRPIIWESSGLWTVEDGSAIAADAGLVYAVDPFLLAADGLPLPAGSDACFRITERAAARRQFDRWDMEQLVEWCDGYDRAFVLFAGRFKVSHAKELALLLRRE